MDDFRVENISAFLQRRVSSFVTSPVVYDYGTVSRIGDGVVRVDDLPGRCYGELLKLGDGAFGMTLDLEENGVGAVLLDKSENITAGDRVTGTGKVCDIPVGEKLIGRVIDPIGRPLDRRPLEVDEYYPVERPAPKLIKRQSVKKPLQTGIMAIDSMIPIGRGQRELIIGDRQTGKTSIAIDTVLNQKGKDVICVYCAIGQKASTVAGVIQELRESGAMDYSVVVAATASDSPAMQYLAPYAACTVCEYFMEKGMDTLVIYDDLSKHAVAYRTMSLLLHRSPGREAYPGDIFYLHSRLLERAASLSDSLGGGTMTALPIIETTGGNISAYIPTNVISITDGQIYLESELFHSGIRPAVNIGLSVSRVGRAAQPSAMRKVSSSLRIDLAQYREMSVFARFGSDFDESVKKMLVHGEKLTELFVQPKGRCYALSDETALLFAARKNIFDGEDVVDVHGAADAYLSELHENSADVMEKIDRSGDFDEEDEKVFLKAAEVINKKS
ncbi:MAG: F0F1 ATP synthase subunit alpha [Clostridiales bacterium]|nr:F0F1 ATP synthase subunit alpha [Clostridiales bacterium]